MDDIRRQRTELENHLIDELISGRLTRREFVRRGTVMGMSIPLLGAIVAACGGANSTGSSAASGGSSGSASVKPGGTVRAAIVVPTGAINPVTVGDQGGLCMLGQVGEFLCVANPNTLELEPVLADSWTANSDSSEWTFKLKSGVTFHDGSPLVADDVVYTMDLLSDSKGTSQALSVFLGVLNKGGTTAVDDHTVKFTLEAANGNFPYLVSRDNYNAIIIKAGSDPKDFEKTFPGTGPFKLDKYTPKVGASFVRNDDYWGTRPTRTGSSSRSTTTRARRSSPSRASRSTSSARSPSPAAGRSSTTAATSSSTSRRPRTARCTCGTTRSPSPTSAFARRSRCRSTGRRSSSSCSRARRRWATTARLRASIRRPTPPCRSARRTSTRRSSCSRTSRSRTRPVKMNTEKAFEIPDYAVLIQNSAKAIGFTIDILQQSADAVLRRLHLRRIAVAGLDDGHHGLRPPQRAQRDPGCAAAVRRHVELGALQEHDLRQPGQAVQRGVRRPEPAGRSPSRSRSCCWTRRR